MNITDKGRLNLKENIKKIETVSANLLLAIARYNVAQVVRSQITILLDIYLLVKMRRGKRKENATKGHLNMGVVEAIECEGRTKYSLVTIHFALVKFTALATMHAGSEST